MGTAEHVYSKTDQSQLEIPPGLQAFYERRQTDEWRAMVNRLDALRKSFADQRRQIVSPELRDRIANIASAGMQDDPRGPGLRYRSLVEAKNAEVDLNALKRLHRHAYSEVGELVKGQEAFHHHETVVGSVVDVFKRPPIVYVAPDPIRKSCSSPHLAAAGTGSSRTRRPATD